MAGIANTLAALACALALAGCAILPPHLAQTAAGRAALDRGDYDRALVEARGAILAQPGYEPAQDLLAQAVNKAVGAHDDRIAAARRVLDWDTVVSEYRDLAEVDRLARPILANSPRHAGVASLLVDRTDELDAALALAAETHYQAGLVLGAETAKPQKREAAREFAKVASYLALYKDAPDRYAAARAAGTEAVALLPFEDPSGSGAGRQVSGWLQAEFGIGPPRFEFVRFVPAGDPGADLAVHGRVDGVSTDVSPVVDTYVQTRTRVSGGQKRRQTTEQRERARTTTVRVAISLRVVSVASGRELRADTFRAEATQTQRWTEEVAALADDGQDDEDDEDGDADTRLAAALGQLVLALLGAGPTGPGPADTRALRQEAAQEVAGKASAWLRGYFASL